MENELRLVSANDSSRLVKSSRAISEDAGLSWHRGTRCKTLKCVRGFPDGLAAKTPHSQCRGSGWVASLVRELDLTS